MKNTATVFIACAVTLMTRPATPEEQHYFPLRRTPPETMLAGQHGGLRFCEGLAPVQVRGKWGYINHGGEVVIAPQFSEAGDFHNGVAQVALQTQPGKHGETVHKWGFINRTGKLISKPAE